MSFEDHDGYEPYEPVTTEGLDKAIKFEGGVHVDLIAIENEIHAFVKKNLQDKIKAIAKNEVEVAIREQWNTKASFNGLLKEIIKEKLETVYPDIVENKINELAEKIKNMTIDLRNDEWRGKKILDAAHAQVNDYVNNELKAAVKKSTDYLEQFSKNYFVNNLFRAMGVMDKMLPVADAEAITKN